jgi:hypothetical protein
LLAELSYGWFWLGQSSVVRKQPGIFKVSWFIVVLPGREEEEVE